MQLYHDSHDTLYRDPPGALPCGAQTRLRLLVQAAPPPEAVTLRLWRDGETRIPMTPCKEGQPAQGTLYEALLPAGNVPGLLWYRFEVDAAGQRLLYGNAADRLGGIGLMGMQDSYQVTVYDAAFDPPHWLREGIMYQIMVDRFFNGDPTDTLMTTRKDVTLHGDWYEPPLMRVAPNGDNLADDFYGGNLAGVRAKLPYLASLGVSVLYLNPIFEAHSNHKYDTGDYERIDPMFGDEAAFTALCADALSMGIRVMLDGVFSHIGADSRYFNRYGHYPDAGAYQSKDSPYYPWFTFEEYPNRYVCWWGFDTLPNVREEEPAYRDYMLTGPHAIVPGWLQKGASGWRLDVADELPMPFLRELRHRAKAARPDAAVLGEVWEDASNKVTYDQLRSYVLGDTLDSVMNYPLREALIAFLMGWRDAAATKRHIDAQGENYPKPFLYSLMNLLGSHDRARILNVLAGADGESLPREQRGALRLSAKQRDVSRRRVRLMLRLVCALPGMPCIYYGDEAGLEGAADPHCRATYPWDREDAKQLRFFQTLLLARRASPALKTGHCALLAPDSDVLAVIRRVDHGRDAFGTPAPDEAVLSLINRADAPRDVRIPAGAVGRDTLTDEDGHVHWAVDGLFFLRIEALEGAAYHISAPLNAQNDI